MATSDPWHFLFFEFCHQFYCEQFGWASCLQQEGEAQGDRPLSPVKPQHLLHGGWVSLLLPLLGCQVFREQAGGLWDSLMTPGEVPEEGYRLGEAIVKTCLSVSCRKWKNPFLSAWLKEAVPEVLGPLYKKIRFQIIKYLGTLGIFTLFLLFRN